MAMEKLTIKELVNKSSIFERVEFMDAYKAWAWQRDGHLSNHIVTPHYELIQTTDWECEIVLLYKDEWVTYELYRDILNEPLDSAFFDRFLSEIEYVFDSYETAELEYRESHI